MQSPLARHTNVKHLRIRTSPVVRVHDAERGLYLGHSSATDVFSGARRSALVLGPTRSGKTSSLLIPNVLLARGSVVTTSTKDDVLRATITRRRRVGHVLLFDPSGTVDVPRRTSARVGWSPIAARRRWDDAVHHRGRDGGRGAAPGPRARARRPLDRAREGPARPAAPRRGPRGPRASRTLAGWVDLREGGARRCRSSSAAPGATPPGACLPEWAPRHRRRVSCRGSGRPPRACWRRGAPTRRAPRPEARRSTSPRSSAARTRCTSSRRRATRRRPRRSSRGCSTRSCTRPTTRTPSGARPPARARRARERRAAALAPVDRERGRRTGRRACSAVSRTSARRACDGARRPTGSCRCSRRRWCCPGIADRATLESLSALAGRHDVDVHVGVACSAASRRRDAHRRRAAAAPRRRDRSRPRGLRARHRRGQATSGGSSSRPRTSMRGSLRCPLDADAAVAGGCDARQRCAPWASRGPPRGDVEARGGEQGRWRPGPRGLEVAWAVPGREVAGQLAAARLPLRQPPGVPRTWTEDPHRRGVA